MFALAAYPLSRLMVALWEVEILPSSADHPPKAWAVELLSLFERFWHYSLVGNISVIPEFYTAEFDPGDNLVRNGMPMFGEPFLLKAAPMLPYVSPKFWPADLAPYSVKSFAANVVRLTYGSTAFGVSAFSSVKTPRKSFASRLEHLCGLLR